MTGTWRGRRCTRVPVIVSRERLLWLMLSDRQRLLATPSLLCTTVRYRMSMLGVTRAMKLADSGQYWKAVHRDAVWWPSLPIMGHIRATAAAAASACVWSSIVRAHLSATQTLTRAAASHRQR